MWITKCRKEIILFVTFQSWFFSLVASFRILRVFFFRPKCLTLRGHVISLTTFTWQQKFIVDGGSSYPWSRFMAGCPILISMASLIFLLKATSWSTIPYAHISATIQQIITKILAVVTYVKWRQNCKFQFNCTWVTIIYNQVHHTINTGESREVKIKINFAWFTFVYVGNLLFCVMNIFTSR